MWNVKCEYGKQKSTKHLNHNIIDWFAFTWMKSIACFPLYFNYYQNKIRMITNKSSLTLLHANESVQNQKFWQCVHGYYFIMVFFSNLELGVFVIFFFISNQIIHNKTDNLLEQIVLCRCSYVNLGVNWSHVTRIFISELR